ncbi:MAG TPA: hypothetical protein VMX75_09810 [Spirochaetia bacterium]|nr:hypothetical protein [Spirochaetia bacterium]
MRHSWEAIGTHIGTIYNVDYLFRLYKMRRFAEADSDILFRLAANAAREGAVDIERFKMRLWRANLAEYSMEPFEFIARERRGVEP